MNNPLVSIIIPTYNRAALLPETLDSVLAQTYQNWECLIIDDGSEENNVEIIRQYCEKDTRFKAFERKKITKTKGANSCRNIGLQKATGDYIIFFDSDDLMTTEHVEVKKNYMIEKDLEFAVFRSELFNEPDGKTEINYNFFYRYDFNATNYITNKLRFFTNDLIIRRDLAKKCNFFYKYQATTENIIMTQLVLLGTNFMFIDQVITKKRFDNKGNNITSEIHSNQEKYLRYQFFYYYNILDFIRKYNKDSNSEKFVLEHLIYYYRKINFKLDVPIFELIAKVYFFGIGNVYKVARQYIKKNIF